MKSDLSRVKAGDNIWTIQSGWIIVKCSDSSFDREPIVDINGGSYGMDGKWDEYDKHPSAFTYNPFEKIEQLKAKMTAQEAADKLGITVEELKELQ